MLSGLNGFSDHGWLNANRQGYNDGIDVFAGEEMIQGVAGCDRRVIVCPDGLRGTIGKFVGGCFGARIDGFEGEERGCLDGWKVFCAEDTDLAPANLMSRKGGHKPCRAKIPAPMMAIPIDMLLEW